MNVEIHGFCDDRFAPMRDAFSRNFEKDLEIGASLAMTYRGKTVLDLWAGHANPERTRPWQEDTIVFVASTTKVPMVVALLMVIDRGLIDLDATVAHYWPEFAQGGKAAVTVRDVLTHQAGVPSLDPPSTLEVLRDWNAVTARIAAEPHWFGGERRICYHSNTFGFIASELIRRVDGRRPRQFFREEIADKIGAIIAMGGAVDGVRYLSEALVAQAGREQVSGVCLMFGPITWGLGFGLHNPAFPAPSPTSMHWGGFGGSWALMDPRAQVSLGYAPNNFRFDESELVDRRLGRFWHVLSELLPSL